MKKLTQEEFHDRLSAISEARKIFIESGITNNISVAFSLYQKTLANKEREIILDSRKQEAHKAPAPGESEYITIPVDIDLEKPDCPDCGSTLYLRSCTAEEKSEGSLSCWYCRECRYEGLSEKSVMRWIRELPEKGAEVVEVEGISKAEDVPRR